MTLAVSADILLVGAAGASGSFDNAGTLIKDGGGTSTIDDEIAYTNTGTVTVIDGILDLPPEQGGTAMASFARFSAISTALPLIGSCDETDASPFKFKLLDHSGFDFVRERIEGVHTWNKQWSISHDVQETETQTPPVVCEVPKIVQAIGDLVRSGTDCAPANTETAVEEASVVAPVIGGDTPNVPHETPFEHFDDLRECITEFRDDMRDLFRDYCENPAEFDFRAGLSEAIDHLHDCLDDWRGSWFNNAPWNHPGGDQASLL